MKIFIIILILIIPSLCNTYFITLNKVPPKSLITIYKQIHKAAPKLNHEYKYSLSEAILRTSKKYNIKPNKLTAILAQESKFKLNAINYKTKDYSIGQINIKTIKAFKFNKEKLLNDLDYSVDCAGKVLADFKRMYSKIDNTWWTRYNSSNPDKRVIYSILVARYL